MEATVNITGYVAGDVAYRSAGEGGSSSCAFRIGCTPRIRRRGDWTDGETIWISVTCWRSVADNVASSVGKGDPVIVVGRLRTNIWTDRETGEMRERLALEAITVGHDLARGTSVFKKYERLTPVPDDQREALTAELLNETEAQTQEDEAEKRKEEVA